MWPPGALGSLHRDSPPRPSLPVEERENVSRLHKIFSVKSLFQVRSKVLIGVVHLWPLPGSPRWQGDFEAVLRAAVADARAYEQGGAQAVFLENFCDVPFTKGRVGAETIAAMAAAGRAVRGAIKLPLGFNVLRNDPIAALALCAVCGGSFVRINVHTGVMLTDQGMIEGNAFETVRYRHQICPEARIFADVHVKHAVPLGSWTIARSARDAIERGLADALIISGQGTGVAAQLEDLKQARAACPKARLLLGSGVTVENLQDYLPLADGFIVGTSLKSGGRIDRPVDPKRVASLARAITRRS